MKIFFSLLRKDLRNALQAILPAMLLGLPLLTILGFSNEIEELQNLSWRSAFWLSFFFSSTAVFYRSFGFENRSRSFHLYTALKVPRALIFLSQSLLNGLSCMALGFTYLVYILILWSPVDLDWWEMLSLLALTSASLCSIGTFLGLMLQNEREILFSLFFLPLVTPIILGAHLLSVSEESSWLYVILIFLFSGSFLSTLFFEFFFDELSQTY